MKHLTHLSGFAYELDAHRANRTHTLWRLADACPTLTFVELHTSSGTASSGWVTIKRRMDDRRYDGWNSVKSLRGTPMEDWSRHFDPSTSNSNPNWDKRIITFKNSRRGRPGQRLTHFCRSNPFLVLIFFSLCAAIVTVLGPRLLLPIRGNLLKPNRPLPYFTSLRSNPIIHPTS